MKAKHLIALLQEQDPEMDVMIQQGARHNYMTAYKVEVRDIHRTDYVNWLYDDDPKPVETIVIEYE